MLNLHPVIQSVAASIAAVITVISLWHNIVIAPIYAELAAVKVNQVKTAEAIRTVEITQAKFSVSIENLAKSIENLAHQIKLERQVVYQRPIEQYPQQPQIIFPSVEGRQ